jgi:hypothetical protein
VIRDGSSEQNSPHPFQMRRPTGQPIAGEFIKSFPTETSVVTSHPHPTTACPPTLVSLRELNLSLRPHQRIVTKLPLAELWDESGTLTDGRVRVLDRSNLAELLRAVPLQFVVADSGLKLRWVPMQQRFEFWKTVRAQIADPTKPIRLEEFPNETAYTASEWRGGTDKCLILLEKHH